MGACGSSCFGASTPRDDGNDRVLRIEILEQESILSDSSKVLRVMPININSTLFASKSPFFRQMFWNGMRESKEKEVTLKIAAYEEDALMDLLDYIKFNTLPEKEDLRLIELWMIADKLEVPSCVSSCIDSFCSLRRSCESVMLFPNLPTSIYDDRMKNYVEEFFTKKLITLDEFPEDISGADQAVIEMVLSRDDLSVDTEDVAYDFLMKWVTTHFSDPEERHEFLHTYVRKLIRFPYLSDSKLSEFEQCPHVDKEFAIEVISDSRDRNNPMRRIYALPLFKIERPNNDDKKCEVLFELTKEVLRDLERVVVKNSNTFQVGGHEFYISFECKSMPSDAQTHTLGLCLHMRHVPWLTLVDFDVAYAVSRNPDVFETKASFVKRVFNRRRSSIVVDHFSGTKLDLLLGDNSEFFIHGILLLKATIRVI